jgi:hypothetical protein
MNKKKMIVTIIAVIVVAAVLLGAYLATRPATSAGSKEFTLTVVHADGTSKDFTFKTDAEYVGEVVQEEGLVSGDMGDYGLYIKVVDGEKAVYEEDNAYWSFYVGEEYAQLGIDQTPVEDGAVYKLVYTPA